MYPAYRLNILDSITVLQHTLCSVLFDKLGETVRNMEFMRVGVGVLGLSQSLDGLESVLVERLGYELDSFVHMRARLTEASSSSSAAAADVFFC